MHGVALYNACDICFCFGYFVEVKLRLARKGSKKRPHYWVVASSVAAPRDGKFLEKVGVYRPLLPKEHPERATFVKDKVLYWLGCGAKPTERVSKLLKLYEIY